MHHSHCNSTRKSLFHWDLRAILIQGFQYLERGQHLGDDRPHRRVCKVSPDTDPSTKSKRDMFDLPRFQGTIIVEESLGYERVWVGEPGFIVCYRPSRVNRRNLSRKNVEAQTIGSLRG